MRVLQPASQSALAGLFVLLFAVQAQAVCTTGALPFNLQNNTIADATQVMANFNQITSGVGTNCASSGANTDITSLGGLTTPLSQIYGGTWQWVGGTSTGSANAQVVASVTPSTGFSLTQGKCVDFVAGFTNTASAVTLNIFATGATSVLRQTPSGPQQLSGGEITANNITRACYDGTQYEVMTLQNQVGGYGPLTNLASNASIGGCACPDLGSVASHNVNITGVTTITNFGTLATVYYPKYRVTFAGALTLTYNATSLITPSTANITTAANDTAELMYLGSGNWQVVDYVKANGTAVNTPVTMPSFLTLKIANNSGTPNTQIDWSWNNASLLATSTSVSFYNSSNSGTININLGQAAGGAACNAMDGEAPGTSAWLYLWAISNGTTTCLMASKTSSNALGGQGGGGINVPLGYIYSAYAGAMRVDGSGNLFRSRQLGSDAQWTVVNGSNVPFLTPMASATVAATTWAAIATAPFVPVTATRIKMELNGGFATIAVVPNNSYPVMSITTGSLGVPCFVNGALSNTGNAWPCELLLESTNVYYQNSDTRNAVYSLGWKDGVNAN